MYIEKLLLKICLQKKFNKDMQYFTKKYLQRTHILWLIIINIIS